MSLYDPDNVRQYTDLQHEIARELTPPVSKDEVWQLIQDTDLPTPTDEEIETLLKGMGYRDLVSGKWQPEVIPITWTTSRDPIADGGGIVVYDRHYGEFRWWFWEAPDDEEEPGATWTVRWYDFESGVPLGRLLLQPGDVHSIADAVDVEADDVERLAESGDFFDQVEFLQFVERYDVTSLDGEPQPWDRQDMVQEFDYLTDVVAQRSRQDVEDVLAGLGLGTRAPAAPAGPSPVELALATINTRRRQIGMAPLDPGAAGWTDDDVLLEAQRLTQNPSASPRAGRRRSTRDALLDW